MLDKILYVVENSDIPWQLMFIKYLLFVCLWPVE
jgi:hypothetical protein